MRQREQLDLRCPSDAGRLVRGRVLRLPRALALVFTERGLVDEDVRPASSLDHRLRRPAVARDHHLPARASRPEHLVGRDRLSIGERHGLASLEGAALGAFGHAESVCRLHVEPSRPLVLDERVADRRDTVRDGEGAQAVVVADQLVALPELFQLHGVGELPEDAPERIEEVAEAGRAVDRDRHLPPTHRECLQHPGQPEVVVRVVVREEDLPDVDQPHARAQKLPLGPLAAIEEEPFPSPAQEQSRRRPLGGRHRPGSAEEDEIEVHRS